VALAFARCPLAIARAILVTLAADMTGRDRTYLEAWGIGDQKGGGGLRGPRCAQIGPVEMAAAYTGLVWRLTPAGACPQLATRRAAR